MSSNLTQDEAEFQGGASLACRDEATDFEPVPTAPLLTIVYEQTVEVLAFLGYHNSVAAKFMFALYFLIRCDLLGSTFSVS